MSITGMVTSSNSLAAAGLADRNSLVATTRMSAATKPISQGWPGHWSSGSAAAPTWLASGLLKDTQITSLPGTNSAVNAPGVQMYCKIDSPRLNRPTESANSAACSADTCSMVSSQPFWAMVSLITTWQPQPSLQPIRSALPLPSTSNNAAISGLSPMSSSIVMPLASAVALSTMKPCKPPATISSPIGDTTSSTPASAISVVWIGNQPFTHRSYSPSPNAG